MSNEEMEKICCWIDLFVPFKGSYTECVRSEVADYNYWEGNRRIAQEEDSTIVAEFIKAGQPNGSMTGIAKPGPSSFQMTNPSGKQSKIYKILSVGASGRVSGAGFDQQVRVYDVRGALVPLRLQNGRFYAPRLAPGQYVVVHVK
jgi:hypothetical protein